MATKSYEVWRWWHETLHPGEFFWRLAVKVAPIFAVVAALGVAGWACSYLAK